jgi:hypothetical protein
MTPLTLRTMPISRLTPAPYNPRKPLTKSARANLRKSLETFGLVEPLIWNERTGHVVGGHARLAILREMGIEDVPVSVVQLDDDRERALNIMLNNLEAQGRYDPELLRTILEPLKDRPEFELTGFLPSILSTLNFQPAELDFDPTHRESVEVTLEIPKSRWPDIGKRIDALVREFDLVSHVKE